MPRESYMSYMPRYICHICLGIYDWGVNLYGSHYRLRHRRGAWEVLDYCNHSLGSVNLVRSSGKVSSLLLLFLIFAHKLTA